MGGKKKTDEFALLQSNANAEVSNCSTFFIPNFRMLLLLVKFQGF
jgi:hypothetical protein